MLERFIDVKAFLRLKPQLDEIRSCEDAQAILLARRRLSLAFAGLKIAVGAPFAAPTDPITPIVGVPLLTMGLKRLSDDFEYALGERNQRRLAELSCVSRTYRRAASHETYHLVVSKIPSPLQPMTSPCGRFVFSIHAQSSITPANDTDTQDRDAGITFSDGADEAGATALAAAPA